MRHAVLGPGRDPVVADRRLLAGLAQEWHRAAPRYRRLVDEGERQVEAASSSSWWVSSTGSAPPPASSCGRWRWWRRGLEDGRRPGAFYRQHLAATVNASVQELLVGLPGSQPDLAAHAVQSLDWAHPHRRASSAGHHPRIRPPPRAGRPPRSPHRPVLAVAMADRPQLQARFQALLEVAQRYAVLREQQAAN